MRKPRDRLARHQPARRGLAPLVCVDGGPKTAAPLLRRALRAAGTELYYHGDYDWPGLAIAGRIFATFAARPWRFTAADYQAITKPGRALEGPSIDAAWDPALKPAMESAGRAYDEELLAEELLSDLTGKFQPA